MSITSLHSSQPCPVPIGTHTFPLPTVCAGTGWGRQMWGEGSGSCVCPAAGSGGCVQAGLYIQSGRGCACSHAAEPSREQEPSDTLGWGTYGKEGFRRLTPAFAVALRCVRSGEVQLPVPSPAVCSQPCSTLH